MPKSKRFEKLLKLKGIDLTLDPYRVNTPEHSKAIYGKVLPIHLERNQARSDGLTD